MAEDHTTSSLNAETASLPKQKPVITINAFGLPVGDNSTKISSRSGQLVRSYIPISFKDWRAVPKEKKDELWKRLQDDFIVPQSYKDKCLKSMADAMRKYKNRLRTEYLDPQTTYEAKLNNRPPGVRPEDWAAFVEHNVDPKTIEQRRKNMDMRKKLTIYHTSGRYGHARVEEKLKRQKKVDEPPLTRAEVWIEAHKRKDGSFPSSVASHVERIQVILASEEVCSYDILNDPLTKVFGVDTRGRVRGVGNNVSRTQIVSSAPALEKLAAKENNVKEQLGEIKDLKDEVKHLRSELGGIKQLIEQRLPSGSQSSASFPPKMTESVVASNIIGSIENSMRLRPCQLMSWRQEVVAHGRAHIGNGTQLIHCKAIPENACRVTVDIIEKGDVELPYPDGYNSTLGEVGNGSFVAWPINSIKFID